MKSKGQALAAALLLSGGCNEHPTHAEQSPDHRTSTVLAQDFGYSFYSAKDLPANAVIDGRRATWRLSHANRHPVRIYSAGKGLELHGGTIVGEISQTLDWREVYDLGNSAAIRVRQAPQAKISGWRIDKAWDGVRLEDGSDGWLVQDVHISNNRDDAIENDKLLSGTLRDSLIDGTYSGISMDATVDRDGSMNTVVLDRVMMRLKPYLVEGRLTHGGPIKGDDDATSYHPKLRFIDCVIAIEDVGHNMRARTRLAWHNTIEARGSYFLNLSDTALPDNYPRPPAGFTVLEGKAARDHWEAAKAGWLKDHS